MPIKYFLFLLVWIALIFTGCKNSDDNDNSNNGFTLSGRILVTSNTAKDDDVNDVRASELPNDTIFRAQRIPNPVILGGYVNQPGKGPSGRFIRTGDIDDFFEVDLRTDQLISLFVADQNLFGNDLDLALLDEEGLILNASVGDGKTESLTVPGNGRYFVQVHAHSGASNYVLSIGQNLTTTSNSGMRLSNDFAPGEVIVQFSENVRQAQSMMSTLGLQTQSQDTKRRMLFTFPKNTLRTLSTEMAFATPELRLKYETLLYIKQLRKRPEIVEASPNYQWQAFQTPNDTLYRYQWNLSLINLPQAWNTTVGESFVVVAVPDTGVLLGHPDLQNKLVQGYDFVASRNTEVDNDRGIDSDPNDPGDQFPGGSTFHGTHVAGTIAAHTNNNEGVASIGWKTSVMPLRVLGKGGIGFDYDIEQAIRFAAGFPNDSGTVPARPADIINLSLGGPDFSPGFQRLLTEVRNAGVIIVAASGNEDTDVPMYPASLDGVISVGAVDINKRRASYSNFGTTLDVVAPGGDRTPDLNGDGMPDTILSTMGDDQRNSRVGLEFSYDYSAGTSMAAPHVAGVISLMKAVHPNLTPQDFDALLMNGQITDDLGSFGRDDNFGHGLINAQKAVLAALELTGGKEPEPLPPLLLVNPKSLNFGITRTEAGFTLTNGGGGDLQIENISEDSGGFLSIEGGGLGDYIVRVDRSSLTTGTFTATITITSNGGKVQIPVILQVGEYNTEGDAGYHYILLVEPGTLETVQEISASAVNGGYDFQFNNVAPGRYLIAAGSDFNNDGFICDDGEACGAFSTLDRPISVEVTGTRNGVDFNSGFNVNFLTTLGVDMSSSVQGFARIKLGHTLAPE